LGDIAISVYFFVIIVAQVHESLMLGSIWTWWRETSGTSFKVLVIWYM